MSWSPALRRAAGRASAHFGPVDIWINSAVATVFGPVERVPAAEWKKVTRTNYLGTVHGTLAALRHMRARNRGIIVQIGSALAYRAIALQAPYCAHQVCHPGVHRFAAQRARA